MEVVNLVARLSRERRLTVLLSTHDLNPLLAVTDRVLYLAGGRGRIGSVDETINDATLSGLYGVPVHVIRERGHIFVVHAHSAVDPDRAGAARPMRRRA